MTPTVRIIGGLAGLCAVVLTTGCEPMSNNDVVTTAAERREVTGSLVYRERIALRPGTVAEIWLEDTSRADAPAREIAHQIIEDPGNPPIPFVLEYDPAQIEAGMEYSVRATITRGDRLLFTTDTHYPVLTRGAGDTAELTLVLVNAPATKPDAPLANTYWKLTSIGAAAYRHEGEQREPHIRFDQDGARASGETGCNSFTGGYQVTGNTLSLGNLAVTQRACLRGMDTERAYLEALGAVSRFVITGDTLTLFADDEALLGFEAVYF